MRRMEVQVDGGAPEQSISSLSVKGHRFLLAKSTAVVKNKEFLIDFQKPFELLHFRLKELP